MRSFRSTTSVVVESKIDQAYEINQIAKRLHHQFGSESLLGDFVPQRTDCIYIH